MKILEEEMEINKHDNRNKVLLEHPSSEINTRNKTGNEKTASKSERKMLNSNKANKQAINKKQNIELMNYNNQILEGIKVVEYSPAVKINEFNNINEFIEKTETLNNNDKNINNEVINQINCNMNTEPAEANYEKVSIALKEKDKNIAESNNFIKLPTPIDYMQFNPDKNSNYFNNENNVIDFPSEKSFEKNKGIKYNSNKNKNNILKNDNNSRKTVNPSNFHAYNKFKLNSFNYQGFTPKFDDNRSSNIIKEEDINDASIIKFMVDKNYFERNENLNTNLSFLKGINNSTNNIILHKDSDPQIFLTPGNEDKNHIYITPGMDNAIEESKKVNNLDSENINNTNKEDNKIKKTLKASLRDKNNENINKTHGNKTIKENIKETPQFKTKDRKDNNENITNFEPTNKNADNVEEKSKIQHTPALLGKDLTIKTKHERRLKDRKFTELNTPKIINKKSDLYKQLDFYQEQIIALDKNRKKPLFDRNFKAKHHHEDDEEKIANNKYQVMSFGIIIEGNSISHCLSPEANKLFWRIIKKSRSLVCCRCSPLQKAEVVNFIKVKSGDLTLAIGDGGNDVNMIKVIFK